VVRVAESGISNSDDLIRLRAAGFDAFLIGESLMRQPDPGVALAALLEGANGAPALFELPAAASNFESGPELGRRHAIEDWT